MYIIVLNIADFVYPILIDFVYAATDITVTQAEELPRLLLRWICQSMCTEPRFYTQAFR